MMRAVHIDSYYYLAVCAPIVVLGAPLGSVIGSHFHRQVLASFNYITDTVALISGFVIVKLDEILIGVSIGIILFGFVFFALLCYIGQRLMRKIVNECEESEHGISLRNRQEVVIEEKIPGGLKDEKSNVEAGDSCGTRS